MSDSKNYIVKAKLREKARETGVNVSSGVEELLNQEVGKIIEKALARADENGRKTVQAKDI